MVKSIVLKPSNKDGESTLCIAFSQQNTRRIYFTYLKISGTQENRLSQNELNSTIGINSTKTAAQNGSELFLGINNKIYMPL
jgi:hypothetical protein